MGKKRVPPEDRFHDKYAVNPTTGCWEWTAHINNRGYGTIGHTIETGRTVSMYAHRLSYEMHIGPIPVGLVIDHLCSNRRCVNPEHLQAVTHRVNILRGAAPTIATFWSGRCKRGHDLTDPASVYTRPDNGRKMCRECIRIRQRALDRKKGIPERQPRQPCGTYSGYANHYRKGEQPCPECQDAARDYRRSRQKATITRSG